MTGDSYEPYDSSFHSNPFEDYEGEEPFLARAYAPFKVALSEKGFKYIGCGDFRMVYLRDKVVIKIPLSRHGAIDNYMEARAWHKYRQNPTPLGIVLAPSRLLSNWCLMMVAVQTYSYHDYKPEWSRNLDKAQVGLYKGRVVAYDSALNLTDRLRWELELGIPAETSFFQSEWIDYNGNQELRGLNEVAL